jgi:hypothetical protein
MGIKHTFDDERGAAEFETHTKDLLLFHCLNPSVVPLSAQLVGR